MTTDKERELAFVEEIRKTLEEKGKKLDPEILAKLSTIRGGVVESRSSGFAGLWQFIRLPVMVAITGGLIVLFSLVLVRGPATMRHSFDGLEDLDILSSEPGVDFYAGLDFYDWLAKQAKHEQTKP